MAKTAAERQKDSRAAKAKHLADVGASEVKFTAYRATREHLDFIKFVYGMDEDGDPITRLIHGMVDLMQRDMSQADKLINSVGK